MSSITALLACAPSEAACSPAKGAESNRTKGVQ
jgi:hypothetical protein